MGSGGVLLHPAGQGPGPGDGDQVGDRQLVILYAPGDILVHNIALRYGTARVWLGLIDTVRYGIVRYCTGILAMNLSTYCCTVLFELNNFFYKTWSIILIG